MSEELNQDTRSEEDLDRLAESSDQPRNDAGRPMKDDPAPGAGAAPAKTAAEERWEFEHGGKKIQATRDQLIKWAQMGYDRPQAMQKFNAEKTAWEKQREAREAQFKQYEEKFKPYLEIDDWASKNPDAWQYIQQQWQQKQSGVPGAAGAQPAPGADPRYDALVQRLQHFEQIVPKFEKLSEDIATRERAAEQKQEDEALDEEIRSIRAQHKDLDWDALDENGKSLEIRVMEHAGEIGTKSFRAAMRDLLHDDLVTRAQASAKLQVSKGIQAKTKAGVLGESPTPFGRKPVQENRDIRKTSYEELEREIKDELRSGRVGA